MAAAADTVHAAAARGDGERVAVLLCVGCEAVNLLRDCPATCLDAPLELVPATELDEAESAGFEFFGPPQDLYA